MDISQSQTEVAQSIAELRQARLEDSKELEEMKNTVIKTWQAVENVEDRRKRGKKDEIFKALAKIDTGKDIEYHLERYQEGTRLAILTKVQDWMDDRSSENRVLVISGQAGMGKSVIYCHFCQHGKARRRNPKVMLQSLAFQLSDIIPEYKSKREIYCISTLLLVEDERVKFFHKSVKDWLTVTSSYGQHDFALDLNEGHSILSKLCREELHRIKVLDVIDKKFCDTETYSLQHGVTHMLEDARSPNSKELVRLFVLDLKLVYAKLCVDHATAVDDDIVRCQKQDILSVLPEESKTLLDDLLLLLRKCHESTKDPRAFLQTVLNEGEVRLSSQASSLLSKKFPNITFMEFIYKDVHEEAPKAVFPCSAAVVCFDVSLQSDYMVCECKNEMLYLWSLRTGKLEWRRPCKIKKQYSHGNFTY